MKNNKIIGLFLFIILVIIMGFSIFLNVAKSMTSNRRVFGASYMTLVNPFFSVLDDGLREILEAHGDKLISYDAGNDQLKQIDQIQDFINKKVSAIFLNPVDLYLIEPALRSAKKAGIPIINVDTPVYHQELVDCLVMSDNYKAGQLVAMDLLSRKQGARIALIDHLSAKSAMDRADGFKSVISKYNAFNIVARYSSDGNIEQALSGMESILRDVPNIDVVFATNDPSAMGVIAALESAHLLGKILVYGVDGAPYAKKMILESKMTATAAQSPVEIGRVAADMAYRIIKGEKVDKQIYVPIYIINKENVNNYGINSWQ
ncbi:sugar ABC transporter substrate-binding protein [Gracilinema caldarium]|uniref:Periplasmic binding protein/LacI transcriptional regulator n=1 Tax=Gracilinema caldarium (strain ATCC 51460 / DSM 7334 / H1) TaxID=744872 RepID=F8EWQ7_GRAC1|nr:sugar ABC transporter substrate-binding protein [Gracilinema caldarium]AEJ18293.1 periplasmic binding protein/LacI transcriptional regulator [Gracilinema caldarium DSM 7334]